MMLLDFIFFIHPCSHTPSACRGLHVCSMDQLDETLFHGLKLITNKDPLATNVKCEDIHKLHQVDTKCGKMCCMDKTAFMDEIYQTSKLDTTIELTCMKACQISLHEHSFSNIIIFDMIHHLCHLRSCISSSLGTWFFTHLVISSFCMILTISFLILRTRLNLLHPTTPHMVHCIFD